MSTLVNQVILLMTLYLCCQAIVAQSSNATTQTALPGSSESNSINQALAPLYSMTNGFLHIVFPKGLNVGTIADLLTMFQDSSIGQASNYNELIQTVLNGYAGFATCVVIGLLLVVLIPLIGLICGCCRCCGQCGGKAPENDPKYGKCKRILTAGLLLMFTVIVIGGIVMVFFSSARLYTIIEDGTIDQELQAQVQQFSDAVHDTVDEEIVAQADETLSGLTPLVDKYLDEAGTELTSTLLSNLTHIEQPVSTLSVALDNVNKTLADLITSMKTYEMIRNETEANYTQAETLATQTTLSGLVSEMNKLTTAIDRLSVESTIVLLETGAQAALAKIPNLKDAYREVNKTVADVIELNFNKSRAGIDTSVESATKQASQQVQDISDQVTQGLGDVTTLTDAASDSLKVVSGYAIYVWYACLALGSVLAFVILLYMCGLMFGCGERPGPDANICNKGCGSKFVLAAIGFTFIFFSLLMLVTIALFFVGSLASSQLCWTIQDPNSTINDFETSTVYLPGNSNLTLDSIVGAYGDCLSGKSLGSILDTLDLGISEQQLLDMLEDQLQAANIDQAIDSINISTGGIDFLPSNLNQSLDMLKTFDNFNSSIIPNMTENVQQLKALLNITIFFVRIELNKSPPPSAPETAALNEIIEIYTYSEREGLDEMAAAADAVTADMVIIDEAQSQLQNASEAAIDAILTAQDSIGGVNGSEMIKDILREHVSGLTAELETYISDGVSQLFAVKCDDLAKSLRDIADVVCVTVLDPWNGLWFSLGWALIMLIPCIITGLIVSSLFRREQSYEGDYKEDLNRGYEGERIPLERQPLTSGYR